MKKILRNLSAVGGFSLLATLIQSCSVVGGIFKAGMVWGIVLVGLVVVAVVLLITRSGKK